jgi:hypothetical protein
MSEGTEKITDKWKFVLEQDGLPQLDPKKYKTVPLDELLKTMKEKQ